MSTRPNPYDSILADLGPLPSVAPRGPSARAANPYDSILSDLDAPEPESGGSLFDTISEYATPAMAARIGAPIIGGIAGTLIAPGPGTAAGILSGAGIGAALGGAVGELGAQALEGRPEYDAGEVALSAGLSAIPGGPFGRLAQGLPAFGKVTEQVAKAAVLPSLAKRAGLHAAEGAAQSLLDTPSSTLYHEGRLPTVGEVGTGMVAGGVLGGGLGLGLERAFRGRQQSSVPPVLREVQENPLSTGLGQPPIVDTVTNTATVDPNLGTNPPIMGTPDRDFVDDPSLTENVSPMMGNEINAAGRAGIPGGRNALNRSWCATGARSPDWHWPG
jgi:hypothetical protein